MTILDNHSRVSSVGAHLRGLLGDGAHTLRIVSAYFTIHAYEGLMRELENVDTVRFLYGDPGSVGEVDPGEKKNKGFDLSEQGLLPQQLLRQKRLAKDCEKWIKERVKIRTIKQVNFLHGKMYHIERSAYPDAAVIGSSNFTRRGLGFDDSANLELNLSVDDASTCDSLKQWFDAIWSNKHLSRDAKDEVLAALRRIGENRSPELVYFKTLMEIFRDRIEAREQTREWLGVTDLRDTQVWRTLFPFQRDGVIGIINRLEQHNGCILADSVGLGKTYTALAVIRYYEAKNQRVLVLCPKKLSENWKLYPTQFGQQGNPFKEDNFHYTVLHHTDLSRQSGQSNGIDLAGFDWSGYGLVVIDESHNFRNESSSTRDENGVIIRHSLYERLLQDVIQQSGKTSVLMLSATPVNTSLDDLRNQIYFMTGKREDAFKETLGITSVRSMLGRAQKQFKEWERRGGNKDKQKLFDALGGDFFALLDAVSIARSRRHVKIFYPEVVKEIGGFPTQTKPENESPPTDALGKLSYEELNHEIQKFRLSIYTPAKYVIGEQARHDLEEEKKKFNFNQVDRERWLIGMIRVNFLKRLESAAPSLEKTLGRTIQKIEEQVDKIGRYKSKIDDEGDANASLEDDWDDEDFVASKARHTFHFKDLDLSKWADDLRKDMDVLEVVRVKVGAITPQRDKKLATLKHRIFDKLANPTTNKDGRKNRKILVFTAFKDTAVYLYDYLMPLIQDAFNVECAMVAGDETKTTYGNNNFNDILTNFAPIGRGRFNRDEVGQPIPDEKPEIDVLIATDCISEGQNLQDCDRVVNYDIHWNPVRLVQRFGRIDRIGSRNSAVGMINFWPTKELNYYLDLKNRVEARLALMDATATGDEPAVTENEMRESAETEMGFRDAQIRRLHESAFGLDDLDDSVTMSDFSLDDFIAQLMNYLERNRAELECVPLGVFAVADCAKMQPSVLSNIASPGVIFCLRQKNSPQGKSVRNPLKEYYLVYVRDDGEVRYNYTHAKQILEIFGELAQKQDAPLLPLCDIFDIETQNGRDMGKYDTLLDRVITAISRKFDRQVAGTLAYRNAVVPTKAEQPQTAENFELVTWLVIKDGEKLPADSEHKLS
ncbi:MAG: helicase-related protein [Gammaproteobacteria bacterium]|nr:helicase-related protein [Gammaproteobacteria bacterium]